MKDAPLFVDWLSMAQVHWQGGLPKVNNGCVVSMGEGGEVEWTTLKRFDLEGSHSSHLQLRCDGFRVEVSGNIGRFNRPDNLFGFTYEQCVDRWNEVLNLFDLPPFTRGEPGLIHGRGIEWSGAVNTRIDLCKNIAAFSQDDLRRFMLYLGGQQHSRLKVGVIAEGETIEWGRGSRYVYQKFYNKFVEMQKHKKNTEQDSQVVDFCRDLGIGREEISLKSRFLTQRLLRFYGVTTMEKLSEIYKERSQLRNFGKALCIDALEEIPKHYRATLLSWLRGLDWTVGLSRASQFRHRSYLKTTCGVDIGVPCAVERLPIRPREIEFAVAIAPDWYLDRYASVSASAATLGPRLKAA